MGHIANSQTDGAPVGRLSPLHAFLAFSLQDDIECLFKARIRSASKEFCAALQLPRMSRLRLHWYLGVEGAVFACLDKKVAEGLIAKPTSLEEVLPHFAAPHCDEQRLTVRKCNARPERFFAVNTVIENVGASAFMLERDTAMIANNLEIRPTDGEAYKIPLLVMIGFGDLLTPFSVLNEIDGLIDALIDKRLARGKAA